MQEVVGQRHGDRFYPDVSGVARSYNFYPVPPARPEEGVASFALGLGKTIVDGGIILDIIRLPIPRSRRRLVRCRRCFAARRRSSGR